jgi:RHS repeat-associated protein
MNLGYTGKPYDSRTGLYNYGYRDYEPATARFTTVDPVRDGSNWFAYVNNDPVNYVDLWGLEGEYHRGDKIAVSDNSGKQIGEMQVLEYATTSNGLQITLTYTDSDSGLNEFNWIQAVTTDAPRKGKTSPYNDLPDENPNSPFVLTKNQHSEYLEKAKTYGISTAFGDRPGRNDGNATWSAELSLMGKDVQGVYHEMITLKYGFVKDGDQITLDPLIQVKPSEFQKKLFSKTK